MKKVKVVSTLAGVAVIVGIGFVACTETIDRGHVGVVFDQFNGGVQNKVLTAGRQFKLPWQKVSEFPTVTRTVYMSADTREGSEEDESIVIKAKDGTMKADLTFSYSFNPEDVVGVQKKYMGDGEYIVNDVLRGQLRGWISEATSKYSTMDIHQSKTEEVNGAITEHVAKKAKQYGVTIEKVVLSETKPPQEVLNTISALQVEENKRKTKEEELKSLEIEKQKVEKEMEIEQLKAEAERKRNEEKTQGLSKELLEQQWIEKWDGKLPTVSGDGVSPIVNMK